MNTRYLTDSQKKVISDIAAGEAAVCTRKTVEALIRRNIVSHIVSVHRAPKGQKHTYILAFTAAAAAEFGNAEPAAEPAAAEPAAEPAAAEPAAESRNEIDTDAIICEAIDIVALLQESAESRNEIDVDAEYFISVIDNAISSLQRASVLRKHAAIAAYNAKLADDNYEFAAAALDRAVIERDNAELAYDLDCEDCADEDSNLRSESAAAAAAYAQAYDREREAYANRDALYREFAALLEESISADESAAYAMSDVMAIVSGNGSNPNIQRCG